MRDARARTYTPHTRAQFPISLSPTAVNTTGYHLYTDPISMHMLLHVLSRILNGGKNK